MSEDDGWADYETRWDPDWDKIEAAPVQGLLERLLACLLEIPSEKAELMREDIENTIEESYCNDRLRIPDWYRYAKAQLEQPLPSSP